MGAGAQKCNFKNYFFTQICTSTMYNYVLMTCHFQHLCDRCCLECSFIFVPLKKYWPPKLKGKYLVKKRRCTKMQLQKLFFHKNMYNYVLMTCHFQHLCDRCCLECSFSYPSNTHHGSMGSTSVHSHLTEAPGDEKACLWARSTQVCIKFPYFSLYFPTCSCRFLNYTFQLFVPIGILIVPMYYT